MVPSNPTAAGSARQRARGPGRAAGCPRAGRPRSRSSGRRTCGSGGSSRGRGSPRETYSAQTGQTTLAPGLAPVWIIPEVGPLQHEGERWDFTVTSHGITLKAPRVGRR